MLQMSARRARTKVKHRQLCVNMRESGPKTVLEATCALFFSPASMLNMKAANYQASILSPTYHYYHGTSFPVYVKNFPLLPSSKP